MTKRVTRDSKLYVIGFTLGNGDQIEFVRKLTVFIPPQGLFYPRRNIVGIPPDWQQRRISKMRLIDLVKQPLPIHDYLRRPLIRRGRWLLRAYDIDQQKWRQFYTNAFRHQFREPPLRIGYLHEDGRLVPISDEFPATRRSRRELAIILHRLKSKPNVFIYADDLQLVRSA